MPLTSYLHVGKMNERQRDEELNASDSRSLQDEASDVKHRGRHSKDRRERRKKEHDEDQSYTTGSIQDETVDSKHKKKKQDGEDHSYATTGSLQDETTTTTTNVDSKQHENYRHDRRRKEQDQEIQSDSSDKESYSSDEDDKPGAVKVSGTSGETSDTFSEAFSLTGGHPMRDASELPLAVVAELAPDTDAVLEENDKLKRQLEEAKHQTQVEQNNIINPILVNSVPVADDDYPQQGYSKRCMICSLGALLLVVAGVVVGVAMRPGPVSPTEPPSQQASQPPSPSPSVAPSPAPTTSVLPSMAPTFHPRFTKKDNIQTANEGRTNVVLSQDGGTLVVLDGNQVGIRTKSGNNYEKDEWIPYGVILQLDLDLNLEGSVVQLDAMFRTVRNDSSGADVIVTIVAVQISMNQVAVYRLNTTSSNEWVQLGSLFSDISGVSEFGSEGYVSIKLVDRELDHDDNYVVLAIGTTLSPGPDGENGSISIYEFIEIDQIWNLIGGESISGHQFSSYDPPAISFGNGGKVVAIGQTSEIGSGSVKVYELSFSGSWNQLGDDIDGGGDYEDLFGVSVALSMDGERLVVGAPGMIQCGSDACSSVYTYYFSDSASTPRWLPLGRTLQVKVDDGYGIIPLLGFGSIVDLSRDGTALAVARLYDASDLGVYVYDFSQLENDWERQLEYSWTLGDGSGYLSESDFRFFSMDFSDDSDTLAFSTGDGNVTILHN